MAAEVDFLDQISPIWQVRYRWGDQSHSESCNITNITNRWSLAFNRDHKWWWPAWFFCLVCFQWYLISLLPLFVESVVNGEGKCFVLNANLKYLKIECKWWTLPFKSDCVWSYDFFFVCGLIRFECDIACVCGVLAFVLTGVFWY